MAIIQVGSNLMMKENDITDVSRALIFRVPQTLRDFNDRLYSPHLVSIGPFHYGKEELNEMEKSKSEAVRRMQKRVQRIDQNASIQSFVEMRIVLKDRLIRDFYGERLPQFTANELAWMVTRDACFLFEFIVNYIASSRPGRHLYDIEVTPFSWTYDPVFDVTYQNPVREKLMDDILLFENQIPLWILMDLLEFEWNSRDMASQRLSELIDLLLIRTTRHKAFIWYSKHLYNECPHVLEALYHGMVGTDVSSYLNREAVVLPRPQNRIQIIFANVVAKMEAMYKHWYTRLDEEEMPQFLKLPTAVELKHIGVKICPVLEREVPISDPELEQRIKPRDSRYSAIKLIRFDEKTSTLYLPQFRITPHSDPTMRSIIAMEVSIKDKYHPRPVTQFSIFMDELIDKEEDVSVLRKAEVISNFLGSDHQVAELFNSLTQGIAPDRRCLVIHRAREGLYFYTRRKYKILWSQFLSTYFSKPWQIAGTIGALLLLLLTTAQVFCLFYKCR